ncbi:hypothetical protein [Vibrio agarivorans]|uniref:hypothetical protein n=1 Tax=Vibrio agarivorans TaxID=153622 RepID=UPI00222F1614|nr:hypothetical protein [Vibrio agarivorans]
MIMEILTAILVVVTAVYAFLTYKMSQMSERSVQVMKEQTEAMSRPYLVFQPVVRPHTPLLYLKIYNSGNTPAVGVKLSIDQDFYQYDELGKNLKSLSIFDDKIDSLSPNQEMFFALGEGWKVFGDSKNPMPQQFTITASYSFMNKTVEEKNHIDLRPFAFSEGERNPIVEELEIIRRAFEKFTKSK